MSTTVGQQLRQEREARRLSLDEVARATHIRARYLEALEAGQFDVIPSQAQARGFLRSYASFLNLDPAPLLAEALPISGPTARRAPAPTVSPASRPQSPVSAEAEQVFQEIGQQLQSRREILGLSLDDIERHTHLRKHYLQALETGDLEGLPSPVQGRGMLNNYAAFLGMDADKLLLRFAEGLQARLQARRQASAETHALPAEQRFRPISPARRLLSADFLLGSLLVVFLAGFILWGVVRVFGMRAQGAATPTAPSIADVLLAPPTATDTATPGPSSTPLLPTIDVLLLPTLVPVNITETDGDTFLPAQQAGKVQVYLTIQQRAWMRVEVDGKREFEGRVIPGSAYTFAGKEKIEILTGNAAAIRVFFQGQDQGALGSSGEVVRLVYTGGGIQTPTPTVTTTPTNTPRPSATPRFTATAAGGIPPLP